MVQSRRLFTLVAAAACLLVQSAWGQAFNVNFKQTDDFPGPASTYAGAGTAGVWNQYVNYFDGTVAIVDTSGTSGNVTVTVDNAGSSQTGGDVVGAGGSADDAALLFGKFTSFLGDGMTIRFDGLPEGKYEVITYAWNDQVTSFQGSRISVGGADQGPADCGGEFTGSQQEGVTYTKHTAGTLTGSLVITVSEPLGFGGACNGVQIRRTGTALVGKKAGSANIDFSTVMQTPSSSYGAVGAAGTWNAVTTLGTTRLIGLDGTLTDTLMTIDGGSNFSTAVFSYPSDFHALQFDFWSFPDPGFTSNTIHFTNLAPGSYRVLTYATYGGPTGVTVSVEVPGSTDALQHVGGDPAEEHALGVTYAEHHVTVDANGTIDIITTRDQPYGGGVSGVQLVAAPACKADFNGDTTVTVSDIFAFLRAWFARNPSADINGDTAVTVSDIFAFLRAWFARC